MNDLLHAGTFFLIFAIALVCYGAILVKTGNKELLPYRAMHTVRNKQDVMRVGRIVIVVGIVIAVVALLVRFLATM